LLPSTSSLRFQPFIDWVQSGPFANEGPARSPEAAFFASRPTPLVEVDHAGRPCAQEIGKPSSIGGASTALAQPLNLRLIPRPVFDGLRKAGLPEE